ncbi:hypothetical protein EVG20_g9055 [Dentipellis fragilis]|uniref:Thioredoxin domain-containing protein n=1 Tax=Dentipellis fragilis TaxID=205917 RepID=A0A4Y9Y5L8_9AGAM|nr:hypothetical protein EVG20_g9055 [Dentipellis fragilis]
MPSSPARYTSQSTKSMLTKKEIAVALALVELLGKERRVLHGNSKRPLFHAKPGNMQTKRSMTKVPLTPTAAVTVTVPHPSLQTTSSPPRNMASIIASAAKTAHAAAASLLEKAQIKVGEKVPTNETVKEDNPAKPITLALAGKNIIVRLFPFSVPCCQNHFRLPRSEEVPGYIAKYDEFKARGVTDVYVVAVNDAFVTKAWKDKLAPGGTGVRFIADDQGAFVSNLGLLQDATGLLGAPRAMRFVIVAQDGVAQHLIVEPDSSVVTITAADKVLALL